MIKTNKTIFSTIWYLFLTKWIKNPWLVMVILLPLILISGMQILDSLLNDYKLEYVDGLIFMSTLYYSIFFIGIINTFFYNEITSNSIGDRIKSSKHSNDEIKTSSLIITFLFNLIIIELVYFINFSLFQIINSNSINFKSLMCMVPFIIIVFMINLFFAIIGTLNKSTFLKVGLVFVTAYLYYFLAYPGVSGLPVLLSYDFLVNGEALSLILYIIGTIFSIVVFPFSIVIVMIATPLSFSVFSDYYTISIWVYILFYILSTSYMLLSWYLMYKLIEMKNKENNKNVEKKEREK